MRAFCAAVSAVKGGKGGRLMVRSPAACACTVSSCRDASFLRLRVALLGQCFELLGLLRDPVRVALFILGARVSGGLLDKLPDVVAQDGDACVEFGERRGTALAHYVRPGSGFEGRPALLIIRTGKMAHPRCGKQVANGGIAYQLIKSRRALTIRF